MLHFFFCIKSKFIFIFLKFSQIIHITVSSWYISKLVTYNFEVSQVFQTIDFLIFVCSFVNIFFLGGAILSTQSWKRQKNNFYSISHWLVNILINNCQYLSCNFCYGHCLKKTDVILKQLVTTKLFFPICQNSKLEAIIF